MKILLYVFFFVTLFCIFTQAEDQLQIDHMTLSFRSDTQDKKFIDYIKKDLTQRLNLLKSFYGSLPAENYKIYLLKNKKRFDTFSKNDLPEWSRAIAYVKENTIILKINSAEDILESSKTLVHELSHLLLYKHFNKRQIPVWLNEGLAEYMAGKELSVSEKTIIANALWANTLIPLSRIDSLLSFDAAKARLSYLESLAAVKFFIRKYGLKSLYRLLENIDKTAEVNQAFLNTVGYDFIDFELEWYKELDDKYLWMVILNLDSLLWASITILAIIVFISIKIRNKKKIEKLDLWDDY